MIQKEFYRKRNDGVSLFRTYSVADCYIRQVETGIIYPEAVDVENSGFTYEELDVKLEKNEPKEMNRTSEI